MQEFICPNGRMSVNGVCPIFEGGDGQIRDYQTPKTFDQKYESIEDIPITQGTTPKTDFFTGIPKKDTSLKSPTSTSYKSPGIIDTKSLVDQYKSKEISSSRIDRIIDSVNTTLSPMVDKVTQPVKDTVSKVPKSFFKFDFEQETPSAKKSAGNIISENIGAYNSFVENNLGIPSSIQNVARVGSAISGFGTYGVVGAIAPFAIPFMLGAGLNNRAEQAVQQQSFEKAAAAKRNIQQYTSGGGDKGSSGPTAQAGGFASDGGPVSNQTGRGRVGF